VLLSFQYLLKPARESRKQKPETGSQKPDFSLAAAVFAILVFLAFLCCFRFQRRKSLAEQGFSRKPIWQRIGYETGNHAPFSKW
jgi:hypothetical protein